MRRTAQLMLIKPTHCISCYAGTQPRVRLGVMPPPTLLPTLPLLPTAATRQVLPATVVPAVRPAAVPPTAPPAVIPAVPPAVPPVGTPAVLDPLPLPTAPVAAPQPLLPTVPAPALPYPAATQPQPTTTAQVMVSAGLYLGHGVMPLPQKLLTKITALEFVEIHELLPEACYKPGRWSILGAALPQEPRKRRPPVTNIFTWLQGFASLVSALSTRYPAYVPEFLAYQSTIIKCYRDYDGLGWAQYDRAFRRQVAVTKSLNWSQINGTLYSLCFAGKGRRSAVCIHCLSDNHASERCPDAPAISATTSKLRGSTSTSNELCRLFNATGGSRCRYKACKYAHRCSVCRQDHPRSACPTAQSGEQRGTKRAHPATE